eukprot:COSAG02_NODE_4768_length_5000_cov_9.235666_7_plen_317_part_00
MTLAGDRHREGAAAGAVASRLGGCIRSACMRPVLHRFAVPGVVLRPCGKHAHVRTVCAGSLGRQSKVSWRHVAPAGACVGRGAIGRSGSAVSLVHPGSNATSGQRRGLAVGSSRGDDSDDSDDNDSSGGNDEDGAQLPHEDGEAVDDVVDEETAWRNRTVAETGGDGAQQDIERAIADLENGGGVSEPPGRELQAKSTNAPFLKEVIPLPLLRRPMFPGTVQPVSITDNSIIPKALAALQSAGHAYVGAFFTTQGNSPDIITDVDQIHPMGMLASIERMEPEPNNDGGMLLLLRAHRRIRVTGVAEDEPVFKVSLL